MFIVPRHYLKLSELCPGRPRFAVVLSFGFPPWPGDGQCAPWCQAGVVSQGPSSSRLFPGAAPLLFSIGYGASAFAACSFRLSLIDGLFGSSFPCKSRRICLIVLYNRWCWFVFIVLGLKPRGLHMLDKHSATQPRPRSYNGHL